MANTIYSKVTIEPQEAMDKICDMIESMPRADYGKETKVIVESFYTEQEIKSTYGNGQTDYPITEDGVNHSWLYDYVGSKWLTVGVDDDIRIESAGSTPDGFLIKLYNICSSEFENVVIDCKWYDENETQCGVAKVMNNIYTEDESLLENDDIWDSAYFVEGDEDIDDVKEYLISQNSQYLTEVKINEMSEDELRDTFSQWKNEEKWDDISTKWDDMLSSCEEAIETEDWEFPISKIILISDKVS
jgi:hypothetical protein